MMVRAVPGTPHLVGPAMWHAVCCVAPSCWIVASANRAHERSVVQRCTVVMHYNRRSIRFAGHDNVVCPHVLQLPQ
jgi:hypothetical protein